MEKVLPKCSCGDTVHAELMLIPIYNPDGSLLCVDQDWTLMEECRYCLHSEGVAQQEFELWAAQYAEVDGDELPF
jgi:hypothetical protein